MMENNLSSIAIIGMAGVFPGAKNIDQFWENISNKVESLTHLKRDDILNSGIKTKHLDNENYVKVASIIENIEDFDANFFGYSPAEASLIDPQQRLLLQLAYAAFEDAGYAPNQFKDIVGAYVGVGYNSYLLNNILKNPKLLDNTNPMQIMVGNDKDFAATRLAYKLGLTGPCVNVSTACSTSLVSVHMACRSLLNYETDMALAGGVKICVPAQAGYLYSEEGILSNDGSTRPFDAKSNGTIFGSGGGVIVLKRLDDALRDNDSIYAVIRGSAINNDGSDKMGFTAPSISGQADVIKTAIEMAEIDVNAIGYIEAHGTATALGDPIEIAALSRAFDNAGPVHETQRCAIGSVKSNIGHLDVAAGIAGLIKTVKALKNKKIPPTLHFNKPNPEIDFSGSPFYVNTELSDWESSGSRFAGVSSFGIGGTNAHVILEEAANRQHSGKGNRQTQIINLSAKSEKSLQLMKENLLNYFNNKADTFREIKDVAYTLATGREHHSFRFSVIGKNFTDVTHALENSIDNQTNVKVGKGKAQVNFMFSGQGEQYLYMAANLYQEEFTFRQQFDECAAILNPLLGLDICSVVYPDESQRSAMEQMLNETNIAQPVLFSIQYSLAGLWMSWGVTPGAMIGHSLGELIAACVSGVFSLEDALKITCLRGKLIKTLPQGHMLAVRLPEAECRAILSDELSIAAVNTPTQCVISGSKAAVLALHKSLSDQGTPGIILKSSHAFHSYMMEPIVDIFAQELAQIKLNKPKIRFISCVTGTWIKESEATDNNYWARHLVEPVNFSQGIKTLLKNKNGCYVEIGASETLSSFARGHADSEIIVTPSISTGKNKNESIYLSLSALWQSGVDIDWSAFFEKEVPGKLHIPGYAFDCEKYWIKPDYNSFPEASAERTGQRSNPPENESAGNWLYSLNWQQHSSFSGLHANESKDDNESYIIFFDDFGIGEEIKKSLDGKNVIFVKKGANYLRLEHNTFYINPQSENDYDALFNVIEAEKIKPTKIIYLWPVSHCLKTELSSAQLFSGVEHELLFGLTKIFRRLAAINSLQKTKVGVFSNYLYDIIGTELVLPEKAIISGLCTVASQEFPLLDCKTVDLNIDFDGSHNHQPIMNLGNVSAQIIQEMSSNHFTQEDGCIDNRVVAYRGGYRWTRRITRLFQGNTTHLNNSFKENTRGVYLVFGGLGNVGYILSRCIAKMYKPNIIIIGRTPLPPKAQWQSIINKESAFADERLISTLTKIKALEDLGAIVEVKNAYIENYAEVEAVFKNVVENYGAITGVIHAAGKAKYDFINDIKSDDFTAHFDTKIIGTLNLDKAITAHVDPASLEYCLLTSSISTILGGLGYGAYAPSNIFMDSFSGTKNRKGSSHWRTINWDAVSAESKESHSYDAEKNTGSVLSPHEVEEILKIALSTKGAPQILVSKEDLSTRIKKWLWPVSRSLDAENPKENLHERHSSLDACVEPRDNLEKIICEIWKGIFSINSVSVLDNFFRLGGDSLLGMSYVAEFQKKAGIVIHVRAIFEAQTIEDQAIYIKKNYSGMLGFLNDNNDSVANKNKEESDRLKKLTAEDFNDFNRTLSYEEQYLRPISKKIDKPVAFILSPPRSGSTLLRVMLAGNRNLCAPEELDLLGYNHLKERGEILNDYLSFKKDGLSRLIETIKGVDQKAVREIMSQYEQDEKTIPAIYEEIIDSINNRILVDKTPSYSNRMTTLNRAEEIFENAKYIQLLRHPCGMINSFKEIRLDLLNPIDIRDNIKYSPEQLAELLWVRSHRNINSFFENIPADRVFKLKFEDLLANPEESCRAMCQFIGVEYDGEMLFPYKEKQQRMTSEYRMLGDPKFHMHKEINPNVANKWSENINPKILSNETLLLALQMGYLDLPEPTYEASTNIDVPLSELLEMLD